jgi:hypothetical protein
LYEKSGVITRMVKKLSGAKKTGFMQSQWLTGRNKKEVGGP